MNLKNRFLTQDVTPREKLTNVLYVEKTKQFLFYEGKLFTKKLPTSISIEEIERVRVLTEKSNQELSSGVGWAAVGLVMAGPIGGILGALFGRKIQSQTEICLAYYLKDGRKILTVADPKTFQTIVSALEQGGIELLGGGKLAWSEERKLAYLGKQDVYEKAPTPTLGSMPLPSNYTCTAEEKATIRVRTQNEPEE